MPYRKSIHHTIFFKILSRILLGYGKKRRFSAILREDDRNLIYFLLWSKTFYQNQRDKSSLSRAMIPVKLSVQTTVKNEEELVNNEKRRVIIRYINSTVVLIMNKYSWHVKASEYVKLICNRVKYKNPT